MLRLLRHVSFALTALILMTAAQAGMHLHGSGSSATAIALVDPTASQVFQRSAGATTGPLALSGTYSGGSLTGVQAQVTNAVGGAVVLAWTTLSSPVIGGSAWSGSLAGVPQGGAYNVQVRAANATSVTATGTNAWYMGMVFILYGQSNMDQFSGKDGTSEGFPPPAAVAGTFVFDLVSSTWTTVPQANGVREFSNSVRTVTGIPTATINVAQGGAESDFLCSDSGGALDGFVYPKLTLAGITDVEMILWNQGEGDANNATAITALQYETNVGLCHSRIVAHLGMRTLAQMPFVTSSLGNLNNAAAGFVNATDAIWTNIRSAQFFLQTVNTNNFFSHSNVDFPVSGDGVHYTGEAEGVNGKRFAGTVNFLLGFGGAISSFNIASGSIVSGTVTRLTMGLNSNATDITPTSGITGFEVSGDNGATWNAATAARSSAGVVDLTTSGSLTSTNRRKVRYQYGMLPTITFPLRDNSTLAVPLVYTAEPAEFTPTPTTTVARPDYQGYGYDDNQTGTTQSNVIQIGAAAGAQRLVIVGLAGSTAGFSTATITPNVGSSSSGANTATFVTGTNAAGQQVAIIYALLDANANSATSITVSVTYLSSPFSRTNMDVWTILASQLSSTTPSDVKIASATATSVTVSPATALHGVIISYTMGTNSLRSTSGTEVFANRNTLYEGIRVVAADASDTASSASSTVTTTFGSSGSLQTVAAAWH